MASLLALAAVDTSISYHAFFKGIQIAVGYPAKSWLSKSFLSDTT
jgi:hypothetical protein